MAATFPFQLVSPERVLFSGEVQAVVLPATEGEMTVLPGHAPVMTTLKTGFVTLDEGVNRGRRVLVRGGFADVTPTGLTVLAESALPAEELDSSIIDAEILTLQTRRDATTDYAKRQAADLAIGQLEEARAAMRF